MANFIYNLDPSLNKYYDYSIKDIANHFNANYSEQEHPVLQANTFFVKISIDTSKSVYDYSRFVFTSNIPSPYLSNKNKLMDSLEHTARPMLLITASRNKNGLQWITETIIALRNFFFYAYYDKNLQNYDNLGYRELFLEAFIKVRRELVNDPATAPLNKDFQRGVNFERFFQLIYSSNQIAYQREQFEWLSEHDRKKELEKPINRRNPLYVDQDLLERFTNSDISVAKNILWTKDSTEKDVLNFFNPTFINLVYKEIKATIDKDSLFLTKYNGNSLSQNAKVLDSNDAVRSALFFSYVDAGKIDTDRDLNIDEDYDNCFVDLNVAEISKQALENDPKKDAEDKKDNSNNSLLNQNTEPFTSYNDLKEPWFYKATDERRKRALAKWYNNHPKPKIDNDPYLNPNINKEANHLFLPWNGTIRETLWDDYSIRAYLFDEKGVTRTLMSVPNAFLPEQLETISRLFAYNFIASNSNNFTLFNENRKNISYYNPSNVYLPYESSFFNGSFNKITKEDIAKENAKQDGFSKPSPIIHTNQSKQAIADYKQVLKNRYFESLKNSSNKEDNEAYKNHLIAQEEEKYQNLLNLEKELMHQDFNKLRVDEYSNNKVIYNFLAHLKMRNDLQANVDNIKSFYLNQPNFNANLSLFENYNTNQHLNNSGLQPEETALLTILSLPFLNNIKMAYNEVLYDGFVDEPDLNYIIDLFKLPFNDFLNELDNNPIAMLEYLRFVQYSSKYNEAVLKRLKGAGIGVVFDLQEIKNSLVYALQDLKNLNRTKDEGSFSNSKTILVQELIQQIEQELNKLNRPYFLYLQGNQFNYYIYDGNSVSLAEQKQDLKEIAETYELESNRLKIFLQNYSNDVVSLDDVPNLLPASVHTNLQNELNAKIESNNLWLDDYNKNEEENNTLYTRNRIWNA